VEEIGCANDKKFCGFKRIKGTAVIDEEHARPEPICKNECAAETVEDPEPKTVTFDESAPKATITIGAASNSETGLATTRPAMMLRKTSADALKSTLNTTGTTAAAPTIVITPVADSYKQNGPFGGATQSTLLSTIISIEPTSAVDVAPGKLELCFAINDETANTSPEKCQQVGSRI
jgi:hypothetical protein